MAKQCLEQQGKLFLHAPNGWNRPLGVTQAEASIVVKLPNCIIVRCTRVPDRID